MNPATSRPPEPRKLGRPPTTRIPVAKPNYSYEKRQRELAKKKKQDEKDAKKRAEREAAKGETTDTPPPE